MNIIPLIFAIIPSIFLVRYFYLKDINKPEPTRLIVKIFLIGVLSIIPIIFIELIIMGLIKPFINHVIIYSFLQAFIVAGFCEETLKLMVIKIFIYNNKHFDEVMDGIVYTIVASLGFACLENILYVIKGDLITALSRSFTAVPLHAFCSGIMGYYIGKSKFSKTNSKQYILKGLAIAIFIHGSYNFSLFISSYYGHFYSFLIFPILFISYKKLKFYINCAIIDDKINNRDLTNE